MSERVLITGAAGQLATDLLRRFPKELGAVQGLTRSEFDITDRDAVRRTLQERKPTIVVNTAAYNLVDAAEGAGRAEAWKLNSDAVGNLADACAGLGATLVHFSTDYVFSGKRRKPYSEGDPTEPINEYGKSKLAGERHASGCPKHLVLRVCGLYGQAGRRPVRPNFVERMLALAAKGAPIQVVKDQVMTPSYTADMAETAWPLIEAARAAGRYGVYHLTNYGSCSFFEFTEAIFRLAGVSANLEPTTLAAFQAPAARPAFSVLAHDGLKALGLPSPPHWEDALERYLNVR